MVSYKELRKKKSFVSKTVEGLDMYATWRLMSAKAVSAKSLFPAVRASGRCSPTIR